MDKIFVTKPFMPPIDEYVDYLELIWKNRILTNNGPLHEELESKLAKYLGVKYISLFSNGTIALISALQALNVSGEVITTPFSFVATTHSLWWNKMTPVFVDIETDQMNIDPKKIEAAITEKTSAILPVHVYGNPCKVEEIQRIADKYNLKIIYDAAHAFGVKYKNNSILNYGDLSVLSFHATKVFSTIEGGAIISHTAEMKHHIDNLKNFGFQDETLVEEPGINGKLNEFQAAYGLLQLNYIDQFIHKRKEIVEFYKILLNNIQGITFIQSSNYVKSTYSYFPVLINKDLSGYSRDDLYNYLKTHNIFTRRYFYPLISEFEPYKNLSSANENNLKNAYHISEQVLCLPLYVDIQLEEVERICQLIKNFGL